MDRIKHTGLVAALTVVVAVAVAAAATIAIVAFVAEPSPKRTDDGRR